MQSNTSDYQFMQRLDGCEAAAYLAELRGCEKGTPGKLLKIGVPRGLRVFIDTDDVGFADFEKTEVGTGREVTPTGLHEVVQGLQRRFLNITGEGSGGNPAMTLGDSGYVFKGDNGNNETVEWEVSGRLNGTRERTAIFLFKPANIEALGDKLTGKPPAEELQEELAALRERVRELETDTGTPKKSALLLIGRALELYLANKRNRNQTSFIRDLQEANDTLHGFSERTIAGLLSEANTALETERKR